MKKFLTLAVLAVASVFSATAGNLYLGGNVGFMHKESASGEGNPLNFDKVNEFTILPEIGYNLNNSWSFGTTIGYSLTGFCNTGVSYHSFEFNPYARWTFLRTSNNLVQLFVDGTVGFGIGRFDDGNNNESAITYQIGLKPGVAFNVTEHFSIVAHVGFLGYKGADDNAYAAGKPRQGGLFVNGNDLTLGFYYNF